MFCGDIGISDHSLELSHIKLLATGVTVISKSWKRDNILGPFYPWASVTSWVVITVCLELFSKAP